MKLHQSAEPLKVGSDEQFISLAEKEKVIEELKKENEVIAMYVHT